MKTEFEQDLRRRLIARQLLLPAEAAFLVGKSKRQINRWIRAGLNSYEDSETGQKYVRLAEVHAWRDSHSTRRRA